MHDVTTPPETDARIDVAAELAAAGIVDPDGLAQHLDTLDADEVNQGAADNQALSKVAILLARAGANNRRLRGLIHDQELSYAGALLDYGLTGEDILTASENEWLRDVVTAMDAGCTLDDVLSIAGNTNLGAGELPSLLHRGMPRALIPVIGASQASLPALARTLEAGADWDDIAWLLTTPGSYTDRFHKYTAFGPDHAHLPAHVRRLAATLAADRSSNAIDLLPVAAALAGQPWEHTVLTLLADAAAGGVDRAHIHALVATARALENDPHLPDLAPGAPNPAFTPPPCLQFTYPALEAELPARLAAAGVDETTAAEAATWLTRRADALAVRTGPAYSSWNVTDLDAVACALAAGASVTDLRLACTIVDRTGSLGLPGGAYVLAAGVSLSTAEQWAAADVDVTAAGLLVGYGMSPRDAAHLAADDAAAWHAVDLLAGGIAVSDVHRLLPLFAGRPTTAMWGVHSSSGIPIPFTVLDALAEQHLTLTGISLTHWEKLAVDVPDAVVVTALVTSGRADQEGQSLPLTSALAYASAVTGQPWAGQVAVPGGAPDVNIALAQQVLAARGITPPTRSVIRPRSAPAADLGR